MGDIQDENGNEASENTNSKIPDCNGATHAEPQFSFNPQAHEFMPSYFISPQQMGYTEESLSFQEESDEQTSINGYPHFDESQKQTAFDSTYIPDEELPKVSTVCNGNPSPPFQYFPIVTNKLNETSGENSKMTATEESPEPSTIPVISFNKPMFLNPAASVSYSPLYGLIGFVPSPKPSSTGAPTGGTNNNNQNHCMPTLATAFSNGISPQSPPFTTTQTHTNQPPTVNLQQFQVMANPSLLHVPIHLQSQAYPMGGPPHPVFNHTFPLPHNQQPRQCTTVTVPIPNIPGSSQHPSGGLPSLIPFIMPHQLHQARWVRPPQ